MARNLLVQVRLDESGGDIMSRRKGGVQEEIRLDPVLRFPQNKSRYYETGRFRMLEPIRQAAAIPFRDGRVCLVTSSSGKRWVFPKGLIDPGHTAGQAALIEAWEEAGLIGTLDETPLGSYSYQKYGLDHQVLVFRMIVSEVHDAWPEKSLRERVWLSMEEAAQRVDEPQLQALVLRLRSDNSPSTLRTIFTIAE
jgi:8-oxo-dGTP pyrophosphatase MutT (NUDIX family)